MYIYFVIEFLKGSKKEGELVWVCGIVLSFGRGFLLILRLCLNLLYKVPDLDFDRKLIKSSA